LRADAAARPPRPAVGPAADAPRTSEPRPAVVPAPVATGDPHTRRYTLEVSDATDDDVHQALAALPPQASYKLTPNEPPVDGR